ncbi:MAG: FAD-dependent oxidoreductase [SAR324 cluster bacterium]|nr:FAD-dependent oxidoreductase [SAR324 cluster bacterium]
MNKQKTVIALVIVMLVGLFFIFDLDQYLRLSYFKSQYQQILLYYEAHTLQTIATFFLIYTIITALSVPGATVLTLASGAVFGLIKGTIIVSFASTLGATLAFLISRFLLRDFVQQRFVSQARAINDAITREGAFYLFTLRLVPAVPFFVINLVMGLTPIKTQTFFWVSQVGMLAGTLVFVNAGTELAKLENIRDILSPGLIFSFTLLGLFPWIARKVLRFIKSRKILADWPKPAKFDRNLIVIGAGSGGLVSAYIAAVSKARVTLVEKHLMGGDCLNTGCVPSKALIRSAKFLSHIQRASEFGIKSADARFDFADVMERVRNVIGQVAPHDSIERYTQLGVECVQGTATLKSPYHVEIRTHTGATQTLTTRNIIIAAGARPLVPPIPGLDQMDVLTSDNVWNLRKLPQRLVVLGGGPIGCELAQSFRRLGSEVFQLEMAPRLMIREDPEISEMVMNRFRKEGVHVLVNHKASRFERNGDVKIIYCQHEGREVRIECDEILCALGRVANTKGYGLEELGIPLTPAKTIETNEYLQTLYPNIYACGDVAGPFQFTHTAAHQAWYAAVNALFGSLKKFRTDYSVIPWSTFTDPEVARVGLNEQDAKQKNIPYEVTVYGLDDLDRAIADGEAHGLVKVLTVPGKDRILGVTIVGEHAGDLIAEYILAMKHGLGLNKILGTIHIYPTLAEANKYAAGQWKRAHAPEKLLRWVEKFHQWQLR